MKANSLMIIRKGREQCFYQMEKDLWETFPKISLMEMDYFIAGTEG